MHELERLGNDSQNYTLNEILQNLNLTADEYQESLSLMSKKDTIIYKRKPNESCIVPYNPVLLNIWQANVNIQYITGVYGVLTYLTSYFCKPERDMFELVNAACKETDSLSLREKLYKLSNVF